MTSENCEEEVCPIYSIKTKSSDESGYNEQTLELGQDTILTEMQIFSFDNFKYYSWDSRLAVSAYPPL